MVSRLTVQPKIRNERITAKIKSAFERIAKQQEAKRGGMYHGD
jgi:hypothetical protein